MKFMTGSKCAFLTAAFLIYSNVIIKLWYAGDAYTGGFMVTAKAKDDQRNVFFALSIVCLLFRIPLAAASTVTGPELPFFERLNFDHGIEFTAYEDCVLTSFVYENQGNSDLITLTPSTSSLVILDSLVTPGGERSYLANVSWTLQKGESYFLLGTVVNNGMYAPYNAFPQTDDEISVTAGVFSSVPTSGYWGDFNEVTTTIPEPTAALLLAGIISTGLLRRR